VGLSGESHFWSLGRQRDRSVCSAIASTVRRLLPRAHG
jgi:hypothetical protein